MIYSQLGNTGLQVSRIGYGNMINFKPEDEELNTEIIKTCYESGINFFDTAENYMEGECEAQLGRAIKALKIPRENLVISTKLINCTLPGNNPINRSLSKNRKNIIDGLNASLQRLQLDYVDIVFSHIYDTETQIEEVCHGFNQLIEDGKAFYWATSGWSAQQIQAAMNYCDIYGLIKPVAEQCKYNLLNRNNIEKDFASIFNQGYGSTIYSPLGGGLLTGKYNNGQIPENCRANTDYVWLSKEIMRFIFFDKFLSDEQVMESLKKLGELAKELGFTQSQLALAWVIRNNDVSTAIIGARNVEQVKDNLKALELLKIWNADIEKKVENILKNAPTQDMDFRTFAAKQSRREKQQIQK